MSPRAGSDAKRRPTPEEVEARLTDLHYALLELMPDEGRTLHYNPQVISVRLLRDRLNSRVAGGGPNYTSAEVAGEVRSLSAYGLVTAVKHLSGRNLGWQKSRRAKELLEARRREEATAQEQTEPSVTPLQSVREGERV